MGRNNESDRKELNLMTMMTSDSTVKELSPDIFNKCIFNMKIEERKKKNEKKKIT